ncbi:hypothetical protein JCM10908_004745 [Rhodotorula pacifica]|uniref:dihydrofolate reductase n=1 Tax=Rhodotorula pacifica TaxID=1495444 RepID=UPI003174980E
MKLSLTLVVAATPSNAIGRNSTLPWRLSQEMAYFARITKGEDTAAKRNAVIMGRKSWEGIPAKFRPLPGRTNIVVSRQPEFDLGEAADTELASSLADAVDRLRARSSSSETPPLGHTFLIGGAQLYNAALRESAAPQQQPAPYSIDRVLLTRLFTEYPDCDTFLHDFAADETADGQIVWRRAEQTELQKWAGWEVPAGRQSERDKAVKGEEKIVEYEYQMWVREP